MSNSIPRPYTKPLKLIAGPAAAALLIGWAASAGAQTATDTPTPPTQQASLPAAGTAETQPSIPLGPDNVREVQNQLIALGFGPAWPSAAPGSKPSAIS